VASDANSADLFRRRDAGAPARVTFIELFFDLVFVFAVTQISHGLLEHFTPLGALQYGMLMLAMWWVWIYTSWFTNFLDPERIPVRTMLFGLMLAGLFLSSSIPSAFGAHEGADRGLTFACAYVLMQVGRTLFFVVSCPDAGLRRNFQRVTAWLALGGVFWIAGGFAHGTERVLLWGAALAIEYASPSFGFWTPGLGRSTTAEWTVDGAHMAERCGLFIIIALGESILVTGATFASHAWTGPAVAAFVSAFLASVALWWIYFAATSESSAHIIAKSDDPGRIARSAYTYCHLPIVAGIIVNATADEFVLAHPEGHADARTVIAILGGFALYLAGTILFKRAVFGTIPIYAVGGLAALGALAFAAQALAPWMLSAAATSVMIGVAFWQHAIVRGMRARDALAGAR
jgi:low temperature requirement protein LtrA